MEFLEVNYHKPFFPSKRPHPKAGRPYVCCLDGKLISVRANSEIEALKIAQQRVG